MTEQNGIELDEFAPSDSLAGLRQFRQLVGVTLVASTLLLLRRVQQGAVGAGYQGDEGLRIFDAYQTALGYPNALYGDFSGQLENQLFGVHPPGDGLFRGLIVLVIDSIRINVSPVTAMFIVSILAVGVAHVLAAETAFRAGGRNAGFLTLFMLFGSFVFNDIRVSSMGEAIAAPFFVLSFYALQRVLPERRSARWAIIAASGASYAVATFVRPEPAFLLPGLCVALWYLVGFLRATLFGAVAGSFEMAKLVDSAFFADDDKVSILNVGDAYFNGTNTIAEVWSSDFIQQLIREPAGFIFPFGAVASLAFLVSKNRTSRAWEMHLVLAMGVLSYLAVNVAAQMTGLSPHASYRIVTSIAPVMVVAFALALVSMWSEVQPRLSERFGDHNAFLFGFASLVLVCGWGAYDFLTDEIPALESRVPQGVRATADVLLERAAPDDGLYVDRMRYFESGVLGYLADRNAPVCQYARCTIADEEAKARWSTQRDEEFLREWGEFNALRMHTYIDEFQPKFIVVAAEEIHLDWERVASGIWGDEAPLWSSHIYPYLDTEIDFDRPGEHFVALGTIAGVEYFDSYVFLVPRSRNDLSIVFEAFYGRRPEGT